jgi:ribosomal protein S18 acetylase RimI-like enzyme
VDGKAMTTVDPSARSSGSVALHDSSRSDWRILRDTILKSIKTSPSSFLTTADQVDGEPRDFWERELESATWAVAERQGEILGIAAAKPPSEVDFYAFQEKACFIESVWIDPAIRGNGVGERLVTYLIEQMRLAGNHKFYLWVFDHNMAAIRLYKRMEFWQTNNPSNLSDIIEIQFCREFDTDVIGDDELELNATRRLQDSEDLGLTYRMLTS